MNGYELAKKYDITVINHSMFLECSDICVCGHHVSDHKNQGSAGYCEKCTPNHGSVTFSPDGGVTITTTTAYCHNFVPIDAKTMNYKDWLKDRVKGKEV